MKSEQKKMEDELRKSRQQLTEAMDLADIVNWEYDIGTDRFTFDDRFYALYGTTADREGGNYMSAETYAREFVHPEDRSLVAEEIEKALKTADPHYVSQCEHRIIRRDGGIRHIVVRIGITKDAKGRTIKTHGANQDITERKRAEEELVQKNEELKASNEQLMAAEEELRVMLDELALQEMIVRESEEKFRSIVETSPNMIWETDLQGKFRYMSPMVQTILGYTPEEVIGKSILDLVPEEAKSAAMQELMRMVSSEGTISPIEFPARHRNGSDIILEIRPARLTGTDGKLTGLLGVCVDITERKKAEEALRESENKFATVFRSSEVALTLISVKDGTFVDINDAFMRHTGYSRDEVIGKTAESLGNFIDRADYQRIASVLQREGVVKGMEVKFRTKSGELQTCLYSASTINLNGKPHILSNVEDITERKRMEEALRQANKKLNLLSSITLHDINNQLMALNGFVALLQREVPEPSAEHFFSRITKASSQITAMIQFTKEYQKIGAGAPVWQDLAAVINTGVMGNLPTKITLQNDLPAGTEVFADPMLEKVFFNLIDNAVRHGERVTEIHVSSHPSDKDLVVIWEDNGVGINADEKERIFERGFGKNTGLGMFLVREILSLTGITISETGEFGKGARFGIVVPEGVYRTTPRQ
jgi:PAS domain S-box-containing protein